MTTATATFQLSQPAHQFRLKLSDPGKPQASMADRHRPRTLDAMVGQGAATFRLAAFLEAPYSGAFLFTGPTGVGKTTAALAIAAELGAVEFGGLEIIKSGLQDAEAVETALDSLRYTPMLGSGWKVVIVDEADYMSPKASQVWLSALEDLPPRSVIVFTTNKPEKFQDRFLDRCVQVEFAADAAIHSQDAQALIDGVWKAETGRDDSPRFGTLAGIVDASGQLSYRRVIRALEPLIAAARSGACKCNGTEEDAMKKKVKKGVAKKPAAPEVKPAKPEPAKATTSEAGEPDWAAFGARFIAGESLAAMGRESGISWRVIDRQIAKLGITAASRVKKPAV